LILISIMVVLVWAQVFMRYVLNFSPFWIEAVARYLMIWALLLSATVLVRRDEPIGLHCVRPRGGP
jgi:TRAP-type C4-dicarboxylate transport system permease small subunit